MLGVTACLDQSALDHDADQSDPSIPAQLSFDSTNSRFGSMRNASVLTPLRERTQVFNSVIFSLFFKIINFIYFTATAKRSGDADQIKRFNELSLQLVKSPVFLSTLILL